MKSYRILLLALSIVFVVTGALQPGRAQDDGSAIPEETQQLIREVRGETAQFRDLDTALDSGYGKFLECFQNGPELGMGQHYVNGDLAGDDVLDPLQPEVLVYEPREDGTMILVALEYIVFADVWDPENTDREPPTLFGQEFDLHTTVPDTPPFWALHIWLWTHNLGGLFADFNPLVRCPQDQPITEMGM